MFFIYQLSLDAFKIKSQECCDSCLQFQVLPIWQKWPCSLPPNFWHFAATLKRKKASKAAICNEATPASSKMQQLDFFGLVLSAPAPEITSDRKGIGEAQTLNSNLRHCFSLLSGSCERDFWRWCVLTGNSQIVLDNFFVVLGAGGDSIGSHSLF